MVWKYVNPVEIIFGEGSLSGLECCLKADRVLVVTDSRLASSEIMGKVRNALKNKEIVLFEDSYHIIIADQERDKVAEKTIAFFEKYKQ